MNLNPYENKGKKLVYIGAGIMVVSILLGATPPLWAITLSVLVTLYTAFRR